MPDDLDPSRQTLANTTADQATLADFRPLRFNETSERKPGRIRRLFSPLTRRILLVNLAAPVLLVLGLIYLDQYSTALIATEIEALRTQGEMIQASIAESAIVVDTENGESSVFTPTADVHVIDQDNAQPLVRRLAALAQLRAQVFDHGGELIADSRALGEPGEPGGEVEVEDLPPQEGVLSRIVRGLYDNTLGRFSFQRHFPLYQESADKSDADFPEVRHTLDTGESESAVRMRARDHQMILTVSVPVQSYKQVVGVVLVSRDGRAIDERLFSVRRSIMIMFAWILALTVLTSFYLAGTIARPLRRLAQAAEQVRGSKRRQHTIPDLSSRSDEIGELSAALRDMTESLWRRMDATERFAADVAHEIKNPLTSLRSAVETVARVTDPARQKRLVSIIVDDVARLDRLISDISDASRLDAELSRAETAPVRLLPLLKALADVQNATDATDAPRVEVLAGSTGERPSEQDEFIIPGLEGRLGQVFRNLIGNAVSFSPTGGTITVRISREGRRVRVAVEDQGPGIPPGTERTIFERFYSERPEGEKFGTHSGLGLSISKQIVDAHQGMIYGENIVGEDGNIRGARFIVRLPAG